MGDVRRTICPHCELMMTYSGLELLMSPYTSLVCEHCNERFRPKPIKQGRSDAQRRSQQQEKKAARRYSARRQPGSGSKSMAKGDIRDKGSLRGECKETTKKSFSLKLDELTKIEKEAGGLETPLFEVQFQCVSPHKTYVILPADDFAAILDELNALRRGDR